MKNDHSALGRQQQILTQAVQICAECQHEWAEATSHLSQLEEYRAEQLAGIQQQQAVLLQQELERLTGVVGSDRETLLHDLNEQATSFSEQREQALQQVAQQLREEIAQVNEQEKSELWMLQSVLDEDAADSPTEQLEREQDNLQQQRTTLQERDELLNQQLQRSRSYLAGCYTTISDQPVVPEAVSTEGQDLVERIRGMGDEVLAAGGALERLLLPRWVRGVRVWLWAILLSVVVAAGVMVFRVNPMVLLNPDIGSPNWPWVGVSAGVGAVVAVFAGVIAVMVVQNQLRSVYGRMAQTAANRRKLIELWEQRVDHRLQKMQRSADKWRREVAARREQRTQVIQQQFADQRSLLEQRLSQARHDADQDIATWQTRQDEQKQEELQRLEQRLQQHRQQAEQDFARETERQQSVCAHEVEQALHNCRTRIDSCVMRWQQQLATVRDLEQTAQDSGRAARQWPQLTGGEWQSPGDMPGVIVPADWLVTLPQVPETATTADSAGRLCVELPALLSFPADTSLLVEHDAGGREAALSFLRTQLLRLLTTLPAGRIRLTLIDPVGLGQTFSALMHLADYDELLIQSRIWTDEGQIRQQLKKITEHMENVFQTYLRSEFSTIEEYNQSAGEVAEPYHFVVVAGFPQGFSEEAARYLSSVLTSGPRCGVHALVAYNPQLAVPPGFDPEDLRNSCVAFRAQADRVRPVTELPAELLFEPLPEPEAADYVQLVRAVGEKSKDARRVEVSFRRVAPKADEIWQKSTAAGIDLPIGRAGAARLQFLRLGRGTSQHVLVAGKTGSGKSTFLHIVITNLALHYSPAEIQFYLIDFKKGVEFRTYAAHRLPHARVVAIESDREFGLSVLERLDAVMQERGELFRSRGVQDVPSFRQQFPDEPMPRLLLLIDEFQEFFVSEDRVSSRASLLLDRLVRQGRAFGVHVMLGSQTLGGAYSLARSTMGQVAVRVALQCSEGDAHLILSEDNAAARLLTRPGEAIYNDANGLKEGNHPFQIAWLEEEYREELLGPLSRRSVPDAESGMIVFEGNVAPQVEHCMPLCVALQDATDATRRRFDARSIWLGEPVAITAPTRVELRRAGGQNLLLVGQEETLIDSLLGMTVLSVCAVPSGAGQVVLLDSGRSEDATELFQTLQSSGATEGLELLTGEECVSVIRRLAQELERREALPNHAAEEKDQILVIRDIGQFRELRREEDEFGLGGFGEQKEATPASLFADLIRSGPLVGIHVVVWADTYSNATRWLSTAVLREFENRIALRMNQSDSASLVDSPQAAGLGPGRALLYRDQTGTVEKFRPFARPSEHWLKQVAQWRSDNNGPELDIESLRIE